MQNHFFKVFVHRHEAIEMWVMPAESKQWIGPIRLGCAYLTVACNLIGQGCLPILAQKNTPYRYYRLKPAQPDISQAWEALQSVPSYVEAQAQAFAAEPVPLAERGQLNVDRAWSLLK